MAYRLQELADRVGGRVVGDGDTLIEGVATLESEHGAGCIGFLTNSRYRKHLADTSVSAVILAEADIEFSPVAALVVERPHLAYAHISQLFSPNTSDASGIHPSAHIVDTAEVDSTALIGPNCVIGARSRIGAGVHLGPNCVVGDDCSIGEDSHLVANVTVYYGCSLGPRALIHAGAVIGSDGFGFANDAGAWVKVEQLGAVRIGADVEVGANTTIDRGAVEDTIIEDGVKLDNLIQVAHNVRIGRHTAVAGCVGIAGSADIGAYCQIGGNAGILGHLSICDNTVVTAKSLVSSSITEPGIYSSGTPLEPNRSWRKNSVRFKQLDDMARRIKALEKLLQEREG